MLGLLPERMKAMTAKDIRNLVGQRSELLTAQREALAAALWTAAEAGLIWWPKIAGGRPSSANIRSDISRTDMSSFRVYRRHAVAGYATCLAPVASLSGS